MPKREITLVPELSDRKKLKELMPDNYKQIIADSTATHYRTVENWFNGTSDNNHVAEAVIAIAKKEKRRIEKINAEVKSVIKK